MDVPDRAVLEKRRGDEQAMVGRLLDERDDRREALARGRQLGEPGVVEPHRDLRREVLEQIARQPELGEDDEPGATLACLLKQADVRGDVLVEQAELRRNLGEGDRHRLHEPSIPTLAGAPGIVVGLNLGDGRAVIAY